MPFIVWPFTEQGTEAGFDVTVNPFQQAIRHCQA
jgi:hypothetical protein